MADTTETFSPLGEEYPRSHRRVTLPNPLSGTFVADDTDNHDFRFKGVGKGRMTIAIDNASDKIVTWALYGSFDEDGNVADDDVFAIATAKTVAATSKDYECCFDPFPFYLLRATVAAGADSSTVSVFANLSAF